MTCPTPHKVAWTSPELADGHRLLLLQNASRMRKTPDEQRLHVYKCPCGSYHVGHSRYTFPEGKRAS